MGFSGLIAAGGQDALMEYLAQQRAQQQLQEMMRQAQEREAQSRAELDERRTAREADDDYRRGQVERQGRLDRQELNKTGVRQMIGGLVRREGITPDTQREILGLQAEAGEDIPLQLLMPQQPKEPKRHVITTIGPKGQPVQRLVSEDDPQFAEGIPQYREPRAGAQPDYEWVVGRDGQPRQIRKGSAQPGDRPYEKGAGGEGSAKDSREARAQEYALNTATRISEKVDEIEPRLNWRTTGVVGKAISQIPVQTEARDVAADLESLAANIAYNELVKMRQASPTGGAVGQVSDFETKLLSGVVASIRQDQSEANLRRNLQTIRESAERIKKAAEQDAQVAGAVGNMRPMSTRGTGPPSTAPKADLIWDGTKFVKPGGE